ncbi:MAG: hypothetical protein K8R69_09895 [Deltaproteobacteria bacterium]|nr:hypothetical protein [Deltaproteobacteria bacterium]
MTWLTRALGSSIGRKLIMGLTGLLLIGFTLTHLGGNLLMYVGADQYNGYAHALHSQPAFILFAEIDLLLLFLAHIIVACSITLENRRAREIGYKMRRSKQGNTPVTSSAIMFVSGAIIKIPFPRPFTSSAAFSWAGICAMASRAFSRPSVGIIPNTRPPSRS